MAELANCPRCHALFMKGPAIVCNDCVKREEEDFQLVYSFVRKKENRTAAIPDIVRKTGVEEYKIREFVKSKRLHPAQFPALSYGCERCGADIRVGRLCEDCTISIRSGVQMQDELDYLEACNKKEGLGPVTYYTVNDDNR
ncbi:flagellar protein YvyF [Halobacillus sp. A1]|uniref:TIGR03826 family flagellar region protein n=1 Tax=Halobacillus sp. A1 TaxID=2880262 RepID=UPI0020A68F06|nr:TIGR03826 family flagellar region protein [Halobacillus sp. A1]MCP3031434.1 flagellar protein YvyF [Halobacillus sp. A1]